MCEFSPLCPDVVSCEEEIVCEDVSAHTVEYFVIVEANVIKADVFGLGHESFAFFFEECVSVEVVVYGVIVHHLCDREVIEESRGFNTPEVFGETLHYHCFSYSGTSLQHNVFMKFITSVGENFFCKGGIVEVKQEETDNFLVVLIDYVLSMLRSDYYIVGYMHEKPGMEFVNGFV